MGPEVAPNHVKFIKGPFIRNLRKRAKKENITIEERIKKDIENFDISIFADIIKLDHSSKNKQKMKRKEAEQQ